MFGPPNAAVLDLRKHSHFIPMWLLVHGMVREHHAYR
jgi:hypothetical protein